MWYAGINWSVFHYEVVVINDAEYQTEALHLRHTPEELNKLLDTLHEVVGSDSEEQMACIINSSNGLLNDLLLRAGFSVYVVSSKSIDHFRSLWKVKTHDSDAFLLAKIGRNKLTNLAQLDSKAELIDSVTESLRVIDTPTESSQVQLEQKISQLREQNRYFLQGDDKFSKIALTFDDGPHPLYTLQILDILKRYDVQATFFCVGLNVYSYPMIVKREHKEKHLLANHTWSHPYLSSISAPDVSWQLTATNNIIDQVISVRPLFFRPPYADFNIETLSLIDSCDMITATWSVDPSDWARPGKDAIVHYVLNKVKNGSIVLLHDAGGDRSQTVEALPIVIEKLLQRDFHFVTLDQLVKNALS